MRRYFIFLLLPLVELNAIGAALDFPEHNVEQADTISRNALEKLDMSYEKEDETSGFDIKYSASWAWYYPSGFDLMIGKYGRDNTIVRVDAPNRISYAIIDILAQDSRQVEYEHTYDGKSVLFGDFLSLLSPGFGYLYANTSTPFGPKDVFMNTFMQLALDGFLLWVGGKTFFTHGFDPLERGRVATAILMGGYRLVRFFPVHIQLIAHNRVVSLGYTFRF